MIFTATDIAGVMIVDVEPVADDRGHFARWYCSREFLAHDLEPLEAQGAVSRNRQRGTLRGLHFIDEPIGEAKLVRCCAGSVFDVAVDMRSHSSTFGAWVGLVLDAASHRALYLPKGCAHGFLTLHDDTDVIYQFSEPHRPGIERGVRWDDPDIGIIWPEKPTVVSERDRNLPTFRQVIPQTPVA